MSPQLVALAVFDGFVNPGLVAGIGLAAVPLVIHLLNRQRHKPVQWAAMRFVLAAVRRTRRRTQLEQLLLLLLRMAAVAALALAIARPFTGAEGPLAGLTETRRDVVVVVDGSASTGYSEEVETVHERIVDRARQILLDLDGGRGDRARVVHAGAWPRLLSWTDPDQALAVIDTLSEPTDERLDLGAALAEVLDFAEEESAWSAIEVHLLSDLQRHAFAAQELPAEPPPEGTLPEGALPDAGGGEPVADESPARELDDVLDRLEELGVTVLVEDLGPRQSIPPNLGITSVASAGPVLGPGQPIELRVGLRNFGRDPKAALRVWIEVDGERRPSQLVDVPARGEAEAVFQVDLATPGDHAVTARFEGDRLAVDNSRVAVLHVPSPLRVLVVNGAPAPEIERDAAGMLMAVLEPPAEAGAGFGLATPFLPREVAPRDLGTPEVDLDEFDVVWLTDVPSLDPVAVAELEERVGAGAALVVSLGAHVQLESYDSRLYRADGSGLLPAELTHRVAVASRRARPYRVREFDEEHPILRFFADPRWKGLFNGMPVYEFVAATPLEEGAQVLARLDDEAGHPLLIERAYDRGKVLLWTTTVDPSWTAIPEFAESLVPLVHELVRYAGREAFAPRNLPPGATFVAEVSEFPRGPVLVRPDGPRRALEGEVVEVAGDRWQLPPVEGADTQRAGLYRVETGGGDSVVFAVQIDAQEGDLERLSGQELESLHSVFRVYTPGQDGSGDDTGAPPRRGELWRWLAALALACLVGEALWAAWIGTRRRIA